MDKDILKEVFGNFGELLNHRFARNIYTTEDSIRYTFFFCLTKIGQIEPSSIILEYPINELHATQSVGGYIDSIISFASNTPCLAFEFKFDRRIPSGKNLPMPQKAGSIFKDLFRLARLVSEFPVEAFFIYVTDSGMAQYFQNSKNILSEFFNLKLGRILAITHSRIEVLSNSFRKYVEKSAMDCTIECYMNKMFSSEKWLRIYKVRPAST